MFTWGYDLDFGLTSQLPDSHLALKQNLRGRQKFELCPANHSGSYWWSKHCLQKVAKEVSARFLFGNSGRVGGFVSGCGPN